MTTTEKRIIIASCIALAMCVGAELADQIAFMIKMIMVAI